MSYEDCFTAALCAPRNETFSYRHLPCRFEYTTRIIEQERELVANGKPINRPNCPYRAYCDASAGVLSMLERVYGHRVKVTLSEPSSTIVVRAEHLYNREERFRMSLRKHFYELELSGQNGVSNSARWTDYHISGASLDALKGTFHEARRKQNRSLVAKFQPLVTQQNGGGQTFKDDADFETALTAILPRDDIRALYEPSLKTGLEVGADGLLRLPSAAIEAVVTGLDGQVESDVDGLIDDLRKYVVPQRYSTEGDFKRAVSSYLSPVDEWFLIEKLIDHAASALNCRQIHDGELGDRFGRYLGFIDLRLNSPFAPLAMGLLALPRRCINSAAHRFVTGEYGRIFGGPGFPCTLYVMHDPETGGAHCAQSTVIMSLAALSDRGARLTGSFTLTYLAYRKSRHRCASQSE